MSADPGRHEGDRLQQIATMYAQDHATFHGIVRPRDSQSPTGTNSSACYGVCGAQ